MRFISVRDLSTKPREIWTKIKDEEVVISSNGKPIALLSGVTEETLKKRSGQSAAAALSSLWRNCRKSQLNQV